MQLRIERRVIERLARSAAMSVQQLGAAPIGTEIAGEKRILLGAFQNHRTRSIAEENRGRAIFFVENLRERFGSN